MTVRMGFNSRIAVTGTSTALSSEAMSQQSGKTYQITDTAKRCLDPSVAVVIKDNGSVVSAANYTLDYLLGRVRLNTGSWTTPVIVFSGSYLPMLEVATARKFSLDVQLDTPEVTAFGQAYRSRVTGVVDASFSLESLDTGMTDLDSGAGTVKLRSILEAGTVKILEFRVGSSTDDAIRLACLLAKDNLKSGVDELVVNSIEGKLSAIGVGSDISFQYFFPGGFGA